MTPVRQMPKAPCTQEDALKDENAVSPHSDQHSIRRMRQGVFHPVRLHGQPQSPHGRLLFKQS